MSKFLNDTLQYQQVVRGYGVLHLPEGLTAICRFRKDTCNNFSMADLLFPVSVLNPN